MKNLNTKTGNVSDPFGLIAIARALLKRPKILVFDEAVSNLDQQTAEHFARTINKAQGARWTKERAVDIRATGFWILRRIGVKNLNTKTGNVSDPFGFKAEVGGAGDKQLKAVLDKLTAPDTTRKWFEPGACFAAGTLVHTKEGLKPIEQIQVGDYVLSKHDSGTGEQAYKRVLQTFYHPAETVTRVGHEIPNQPNTTESIVCTLNHPFWVARVRDAEEQSGWTAAGQLPTGWGGGGRHTKFEMADGGLLRVSGCGKIYASEQEGVGWTPAHMSDLERPGNFMGPHQSQIGGH